MSADLENMRGAVTEIAQKAREAIPTKVYVALWCDAATWEAEVDDPSIRHDTVFDFAAPEVGRASLTMSDEWIEACKKAATDEWIGFWEGADAEEAKEAEERLSELRWTRSDNDKLHIWFARPVGEKDSSDSVPEIVLVIREVPLDA